MKHVPHIFPKRNVTWCVGRLIVEWRSGVSDEWSSADVRVAIWTRPEKISAPDSHGTTIPRVPPTPVYPLVLGCCRAPTFRSAYSDRILEVARPPALATVL